MQLKIARVKPTFSNTLNANRSFIEMFMSNMSVRYGNIALTTIRDPEGLTSSLPLVSYFLFNADDIIKASRLENKDMSIELIYRFVSLFVEEKTITLEPKMYYIPKFNLFHYGNICHLNTCLLQLASLYHLLAELSVVADPPHDLDVLYTILTSSYSRIDMTPCSLLELIEILNIDTNIIMPAEETMISLVKILHKRIPKTTLLHWDFAHHCLPKEDEDLDMNAIVNKYAPTYILFNGQDFNVSMEVPKDNQFIARYSSGEHVYQLASIIVHMHAHFINIFFNDKTCTVKDDLCHRYAVSPLEVAKLGNIQVTEVCYVKIN